MERYTVDYSDVDGDIGLQIRVCRKSGRIEVAGFYDIMGECVFHIACSGFVG